jgi:hypothetical protein
MKTLCLLSLTALLSASALGQTGDTASSAPSLNKVYYPSYSDKKRLPDAIGQGYIMYTLGIDFFTGGSQTPYKRTYFFQDTYGIPVRKNHAFVELFYDAVLCRKANADFYRTNFDSASAPDDLEIDPVFSFGFGGGLQPVLVSGRSIAITAGPEFGGRLIFLPNLSFSYLNDAYGADNNFQRGNFVSAFWGAKANIFLGKFLMTFEYCMLGNNKQPIKSTSNNTVVDINYNYFRIGIGGHF